MKKLKNLRIQFGNRAQLQRKNIHKHSIYMQSRDSSWLSRNMSDDKQLEDELRNLQRDENGS